MIRVLSGSLLRRLWIVALALALGACAATPGQRVPQDPFEPFNRSVDSFNSALDRNVTKPIAQAYVDHVHEGWRNTVSNVFDNLGDVWTAVNQLLQGKPLYALNDAGRFLINSTVGFGGLVDLASEIGMPRHKEDFGQTLGRWGIGPGPYLVLPVLGPSSVRDAVALVPDYYGNPIAYLDEDWLQWTLYAVRLIDVRASLLSAEKVIDQAALDRYSFIRDGYLQRRRSLVYDGDPPDEPDEGTQAPPK